MSIFSLIFGKKKVQATGSDSKTQTESVTSDIKHDDARRDHIAFVDTEVGLKDHKIHDIGALRYDGATYHQASKDGLTSFLKEGKVDFICGHNIIHHDAKYLQLDGILIDTLYLSPLLFPKHPYHHLVKDDKLMSEQMNNPVNDCEKAKELLMDEIAAWNQLSENKKRIFTLLLQHEEEFRALQRRLRVLQPTTRHSPQSETTLWLRCIPNIRWRTFTGTGCSSGCGWQVIISDIPYGRRQIAYLPIARLDGWKNCAWTHRGYLAFARCHLIIYSP